MSSNQVIQITVQERAPVLLRGGGRQPGAKVLMDKLEVIIPLVNVSM